jgi:RND family efflux transporter MFP subunit
MMNMNLTFRKPLIAAACVLLVAGTALVWPDSRAADAPKAVVKPALTVTLTKLTQGSLPLSLNANGNITAWQEAIIGAEVGGLRLAEVRANVGDSVKKGQVLAVFAQEQVQADLAVAQAAVAEAQASAGEAKANADRARALKGTGALSEQQMGQFLAAEQASAARLDMARAQLTNQQIRTKNSQVTAPDNGQITARNATVGAVAGVGTELFRMIRGGRLEWRAEVTAAEVAQLKPGAKARLTASSGVATEGRVRQIAPSVDAQSRAVLVYVDIAGKPGIKAGMFARGEFEMGAAPAMTLPQSAVVVRDGFSYVMVAQKPAEAGADAALVKLTQTKVSTGRRSGDRIEVTGGLKAEAQVVATGVAFLADGDLVKVVSK